MKKRGDDLKSSSTVIGRFLSIAEKSLDVVTKDQERTSSVAIVCRKPGRINGSVGVWVKD